MGGQNIVLHVWAQQTSACLAPIVASDTCIECTFNHFSSFHVKSKTVSVPKTSVIWHYKGMAGKMAWDAVVRELMVWMATWGDRLLMMSNHMIICYAICSTAKRSRRNKAQCISEIQMHKLLWCQNGFFFILLKCRMGNPKLLKWKNDEICHKNGYGTCNISILRNYTCVVNVIGFGWYDKWAAFTFLHMSVN